MSKPFNPADKLDLPTPPEGFKWSVRDEYYLGPVMQLRKQYSIGKLKWTREHERRSPTKLYSDGSSCPLDVGLEHAAEVIMQRLKRREAYYAEVNSLYDSKVYLDDLIPTEGEN